ncbi:CENP-S complex, centromere protein X [Moelleriella libera RCEF 2490]|uniref:CENP-S complex, centromere protein X n=1 Tax=Moelleriella libera RCEF 2490 TaxID=1081109 RepID=A0A166PQY1_9HYPO|nr:CENP-S complex, centromere protein X [Moelleriella libera RCEF 2490]
MPVGATGRGRGRPRGSKNRGKESAGSASSEPSDSLESEDQPAEVSNRPTGSGVDEEVPAPEKTIPKDLLTRILHEFFSKDATRISRDANAAVGKYMDIFVREAIARAAVEKSAGFLEVEDLEKVAPQLLLDL